MLYTGGTTGMPKGVMWRQDDLFRNVVGAGFDARVRDGEPDMDVIRERVQGPGTVGLPACPLMHGTGCMTQLIVMSGGGCVVTLESRGLDVEELLDTIEREKVNAIAIVGDAFGKPILRALDAEPDRWDLSSLFIITSSGVMFSEPTKQGLLKHLPTMMIVDAFSSSEAVGMGQSVSSAGGTADTAKFMVGENTRVVDEDGHDVKPGSGEIGRVAVGGYQPVGYYKDEAKSAATFLDDRRPPLLGARRLRAGRGGRLDHPARPRLGVHQHRRREGLPRGGRGGAQDPRDGRATRWPSACPTRSSARRSPPWSSSCPAPTLDEADVIAHVKSKLAVVQGPEAGARRCATIGRAPNGKVDYKRLKQEAYTALGIKA